MTISIIVWAKRLPSLAAVVARTNYRTVATVSLGDWADLDEATQWCAGQWLARAAKYQRHLDVPREQAVFTFADDVHAVEFSLRFG